MAFICSSESTGRRYVPVFFVSEYGSLDRIRSNEQVILVDEVNHCFHNKGS